MSRWLRTQSSVVNTSHVWSWSSFTWFISGKFFSATTNEILVEWDTKLKWVNRLEQQTEEWRNWKGLCMCVCTSYVCLNYTYSTYRNTLILYVTVSSLKNRWRQIRHKEKRAIPVECTRKRQSDFFSSWVKNIHAMREQYKEVTAS